MIICIGAFDLFHVGHLRFLKKVKELAEEEELVRIYVVCDKAVSEYKGKDRPIIPLEQRMEIINALGLGQVEQIDTYDMFEAWDGTPRLICIGEDQTQIIVPEYWHDRIVKILRDATTSTSEIIERIKKC